MWHQRDRDRAHTGLLEFSASTDQHDGGNLRGEAMPKNIM
jgi:hypothetical protein